MAIIPTSLQQRQIQKPPTVAEMRTTTQPTPTQIAPSPQINQEQLAQEQSSKIDEIIRQTRESISSIENKLRVSSGDMSERQLARTELNLQRKRSRLSAFSHARQYATGQYSTGSLLQFASQTATSSFEESRPPTYSEILQQREFETQQREFESQQIQPSTIKTREEGKIIQRVRTPPGYATKEMESIYEKYSKRITRQRGETQYEYAQRIVTDPSYQREIQQAITQPAAIVKMREVAKKRGFVEPERFGKPYPISRTSPSLSPVSSLSAWKPEHEEQYYQKPLSQATKEFKNIMSENVKSFLGIGGRQHDYRNPFESFRDVGKRISEVKSTQPSPFLKRGTIAPDEDPFYTYGELQTQQDITSQVKVEKLKGKYAKIIADFHAELQEKLETGEITLEQANERLVKKLDELDADINKDIDKLKVPPRFYPKGKQTGATLVEFSKFAGETALFLSPFTSAVYGATRFDKGGVVTIEDAKKGVPLYPDVKVPTAQKLQASAYIVGAGLGAGLKLRGTERSMIEQELKQLAKQPIKFKQIQFVGEGKTRVIAKGVQEYRGLSTETQIIGDVFKTGERTFIMPKGYGVAGTRGQLSWDVIGGSKPTYITSAQEFLVGGKGVSFQLDKSGKLIGTISTETAIPTRSIGFLFTTQPAKSYLRFPSPTIRYKPSPKKLGGEMAEQLIENVRYGGVTTKELTTSLSVKLKQEPLIYGTITKKGDIGISRVIYMPEKTGIKMFRQIGGKKTPLWKTFAEEPTKEVIQKTIQKPIVTSSFLQPSIKRGAKASVESAIKLIPKTTSRYSLGSLGVLSGVEFGESRFASIGVLSSRFNIIEREKEKIKELSKARTRLKQKQKEALTQPSILNSQLLVDTKLKQEQALIPLQALKQREVLKQDIAQDTVSVLSSVTHKPKITPSVSAGIGGAFGFGFLFPGEKPTITKQQPFNAYAYIDATKKKKAHWKKVNAIPLTKRSAMSQAAKYVDENISSRGKVMKSKPIFKMVKGKKKKVVQKAKDTGEDYFGTNRPKFRTWKQKKGRRMALPSGHFIERQPYRLDKPGELRGIAKGRRRTPFGF